MTSAAPPLSRIHHVAIICSDYERSKRFYAQTLGLRVIRETWRAERRSWKLDLAVGEHGQIELFSFPDAPPRPSYPEARGLRHLAFATDDLDACVSSLTAAGVAVEPVRLDELTGKRFVFFSDPDGLPLELYEA
ncbi:VOC family protein [Paraburkholderia sp. NMBU_R16]|uniref:SMU1112c/YaeR family gloxylase I-like metalloprotein n=1 Tax=Paraburkholderia sp. NMBU_R16 TaxID=2698676 RepID=UPI001566BCE7|nr:VOC family protein [Paraburkholderia sp. NMBU_R16]NRO95735.1 VOC family protein [Paraburkholderia sp. NMBU_R16]